VRIFPPALYGYLRIISSKVNTGCSVNENRKHNHEDQSNYRRLVREELLADDLTLAQALSLNVQRSSLVAFNGLDRFLFLEINRHQMLYFLILIRGSRVE